MDTILRKITGGLLTALAVLPVALGAAASAASNVTFRQGCVPPPTGPERYRLWVGVCGPAHVIRNVNYTYGVVVKNFGKRTSGRSG